MRTIPGRILIFTLVSATSTAVVDAPAAATSCRAAVVVDGRLLFGYGQIAAAELPRIGEERRAVEPACNDESQDEPDRTISVLTLEGVPPDVAVVRRGSPTELYVAEGSLVVSAAHPLHRTVYGRRWRPARRRTCRRAPHGLRGTLAVDNRMGTGGTLALRSGRETIVIVADARTRLTNRPSYEPLNPGQRLAIRTSVCGNRRVADTIAFEGPTVPAQSFETDTGGGIELDRRWIVALAFVAAIGALLLAARRLGRDRP